MQRYEDICRFYKKFVVRQDGCWAWQGVMGNEYGSFCSQKKTYPAHRFSYEIHKGEIEKGMVIMHLCNFKRCVNPEHLKQGTSLENNISAIADGLHKSYRGEGNPMRKLTLSEVEEIKQTYIPYKITAPKLAEKFGVNRMTILRIVNRQTWV